MAYGDVNHLMAVFTYSIQNGVLCFVDLAEFNQNAMSITNDAEAVVHWAYKSIGADQFDKIIYQDTEGTWDELVADGTKFVRFASIGERDLERAIQKVRNESI